MSAEQIKFGTDGWRGIIADDFTDENVRLVARAIASYVLKSEDSGKGLVVGYDTRFGSPRFAQIVSEELAAAGIPVRLADDYTPTPALSYGVKHLGAAGGVVVTSSHNPWAWNGIKYKAGYGGSATPAIVQKIEAELRAGARPKAAGIAEIIKTDFKSPYVEAIAKFADLPRIARSNFKFAVDVMHGAGRGVLAGIFSQHGISFVEVRGEESGGIGITRHLPERDGILNSLLLAAIMAEEGKTLAQLVADLQREFGEHHYGRLDLHIPEEIKQNAIRRASNGVTQLGRYSVVRTANLDGVKFYLDAPTAGGGADAWVLLRASGTEPLLRIYSEAASPELVQEILHDAEAFVRQ